MRRRQAPNREDGAGHAQLSRGARRSDPRSHFYFQRQYRRREPTVRWTTPFGIVPIPGCAPQCLPRNLIEPGNLPAGKYQTRYFFAGEMTLLFAKGWLSGEDSTGEFWASPKSNQKARVIFWEDVYAAKPAYPGYWHPDGPLRPTSASLLATLQKNPNYDGLEAEEREDRHDPRSRRRHRRLGWSGQRRSRLSSEGLCQLPVVPAVG